MMKVGIITLFHNNYNYGAYLQAYALQKAIEAEGHQAVVIDYERNLEIKPVPISFTQKIKNRIFHLKTYGDWVNLFGLISKQKFLEKISDDIQKRKNAFDKFAEDYMQISEYYNYNTIKNANHYFDAFVCGSDQIWRPTSFDENYYLSFVASGKRKISYAASMGVSHLRPEDKAKMLPAINALDFISVREMEAKRLIEKDIDKSIVQVLDPTLLWDRAFWEKRAVLPSALNGKKYIFSYLIGEDNQNRLIVKRMAKKIGLPIVVIPGISIVQKYDFCYGDYNIIDAGPAEFLGLIQNAEYVFTDSFHACVFSIQFGKKFYALERYKKNTINSMNGRIYDLLELFSLKDRLLTSALEKKAFGKANFTREQEKKELSWKYLRQALS